MSKLTTEQCIEIALKVWGWSPGRIQVWDECDTEMLNSWQGFGRTVEAMREKGWDFGIAFCSEAHGDCLGFERHEYYPIHWTTTEPRSLIPATHLAALEAKKND